MESLLGETKSRVPRAEFIGQREKRLPCSRSSIWMRAGESDLHLRWAVLQDRRPVWLDQYLSSFYYKSVVGWQISHDNGAWGRISLPKISPQA